MTRRSIHALLTFDAASWASRLAPTPLLVVHGRRDDYCPPAAAERVASAAEAEVVWLDADEHIALYDVDALVTPAVTAIASFLTRRLQAADADPLPAGSASTGRTGSAE